MKLFKVFLILIFVSTIILSIYSLNSSSTNQINPNSSKNDFYLQLEHSLQTAKINIIKSSLRDYQNQFEFYVIDDNNNPTKIILSTKKNPYWQIASLQEILKKAKINNKPLQLVDLSIDHPYATFKNN